MKIFKKIFLKIVNKENIDLHFGDFTKKKKKNRRKQINGNKNISQFGCGNRILCKIL